MRREIKTITKEEALAQVNGFLQDQFPELGAEARWDGVYHVFTMRLWADECRVDCRLPYGGTEWKIEIGWSSTTRSVPQAVATLAVYHRAVAFAAAIETFVGSLPPISKSDN